MKQALLILLMIVSISVKSQTTGTFSYRVVQGLDTTYFDIYTTPTKIAIEGSLEKGLKEFVLIDIPQKKTLELIETEEGKEAYTSKWDVDFDEESLLITDLSEFLLMGPAPDESYKIYPEKKTIHGIPCQKFEFLDEETGSSFSTGWFAPGLHLKLNESVTFMELKEGVIISMQNFDEDEAFVFELAKHQNTIDQPAKVFSLSVPEGYELINWDDMEDGETEEER